jgi:hypothetical protein
MQQLATELSTYASSQNLYWAYWYFRYLTNPAQLLIIEAISLGNTSDLDGSAFMRQCQTNVAVLSLLDSSNRFAQEYVKVVQLFQLGNVLPTLFDFSGTDTDDFVFDIQLILAGIAENYKDSSDQDIRDTVDAAVALAQDQKLRDYVELVQSIAASNAGFGAWDQVTPQIQQRLDPLLGAKATWVFMTALAGVGVYSIVMATKQWSSLSDRQRAMLITGGAALAIELVCAIVKRGVAIGTLLGDASIGQILRGLWDGDTIWAAYGKLNSGLRKWIVDQHVYTDPSTYGSYRWVTIETADARLIEGPPRFLDYSQSVPEKIFGRNLDDFLATRIAAFVNVIFLVYSILDAENAGDPLERMADGWMAAAAGLDLIAAAAGWALGALNIYITSGLGSSIATICSAIGYLGVLAALVGVALLLYLIFRPQKNPVQQFTSDYAAPAGFFLPYGSEIDYFVGYAQDGQPQRMGCSFVVNASATPETVLSVASDGTTVGAAAQSFGYNSVFVISTDGNGQSRVITLAQNSSGGLETKVLTWATDNTVSFRPTLDPKNEFFYTQLWSIGLQAPPQMNGSFPACGMFRVIAIGASGASNALVWNGNSLVLGSGSSWTIEQVPMAMAGLSMENIGFYPFSRGRSFRPILIQDGSTPQTWSVEPALPSFLQLDTATGQITQTNTSDLPVTPPTKYTLSVTNGVGTAPVPASFTIEVDAPPS